MQDFKDYVNGSAHIGDEFLFCLQKLLLENSFELEASTNENTGEYTIEVKKISKNKNPVKGKEDIIVQSKMLANFYKANGEGFTDISFH